MRTKKPERGQTAAEVRDYMAKHPDAKVKAIANALPHLANRAVSSAYYLQRARAKRRATPAAASDSPLENLVGKLPGVGVRLGDVPLDVQIINGQPLGVLRVSKDGIAFRKAHGRPGAVKSIGWDKLAAIADVLG